MDIWDALQSMRRRWKIGIPLLIVSVAAAFLLGSSVSKEYEVTAQVLLVVPPPPVAVPADPNANYDDPLAFRSFSNTMRAIAEASTSYLDSNSVRGELVDQGLPGDYVVEQQTSGPIVFIQVISTDAAESTRAVEQLIQKLQDDLQQRQEIFATAPNPEITTQILAPPDRVTVSSGSRLRVTVLVGAVLVVFTVMMVAVFDALALRRRARRAANGGASPNGERDPDTVATASAGRAKPAPPPPPAPDGRRGTGANGRPSTEPSRAANTPD
jgi:uncharacterized protein involved in exopolysaccharide biosynthesis